MLPPIGSRPPGVDPTQRRMDRNMERFMRTPQGAAMQAQAGMKVQERQQMIQPVPLGNTGQFVIPLTGQVLNPETGEMRQMTPEEAAGLGLEPVEATPDGRVKYGRPQPGKPAAPTRLQFIKGEYLPGSEEKTPDQWADPLTGLVWNVGDPTPPEVLARQQGGGGAAAPAGGGGYNPFQ
jgi:hypothetical protein